MESNLGTRLDWIGAPIGTPTTRLCISWRAAPQTTVPISSSRAIASGLRSRATELVSAELGPRCEHEIRSALAREVEAERWTCLDAAIRMTADDIGFIDLTAGQSGRGRSAGAPSRRRPTARHRRPSSGASSPPDGMTN
jgi:type IV secretory pathway VirD2 relaxase